MYFIYVIENLLNGDMYVGQTNNPAVRKRQHFSIQSDCPYVKNAIIKYGKDNLEFYIIDKCETIEEANTKEIFWIKELDTLRPFGYNLREGGKAGGSPSLETRLKMRMSQLGKKQSESQKKKRADTNRGRKNTSETIEKMRRSSQGRSPEKCSMFGKKHSVETRLKMSISQTKTHCKRGHPLNGKGSDVAVRPSGKRECRICCRVRRLENNG